MQITCMEKEFVKTLKKHLVEYHDFYLKSNMLLLANVFENVILKSGLKDLSIRSCKIYFGSWQAALKKTEIKLDLLTSTDVL